MFTSLGFTVDELHRRRYGPLTDADLSVGSWRELRDDELDALRRAAEHVDACVDEEPEEHGVTLAAESIAPAAADAEDAGPVDATAPGDVGGEVGDTGLAGPVDGAQEVATDAGKAAVDVDPVDSRSPRPDATREREPGDD
ncbi:MAG: hypothetical protein FJ000_10260 [Actinobacteria bacterium]|nr:hypothetical protein [Actinomycetota bacterium]